MFFLKVVYDVFKKRELEMYQKLSVCLNKMLSTPKLVASKKRRYYSLTKNQLSKYISSKESGFV